MIKVLVVSCIFSFALPILYGVVAFYMWCAHWVDRYTFLRRLSPPPMTHRQMSLLLTYIFPIAIMLHSGMALKFLSDICYRDDTDNSGRNLVIGGIYLDEANAPCSRVFSESGRCLANYSKYGDSYLTAVEEAAGFALSAGKELSLRCWVANRTGEGAICINQLQPGCSIEWSGAYIVIFISCILWCSSAIFFLLRDSQWFADRRRAWGLERINLFSGATWHINFLRFMAQRDVAPQEEGMIDAHVFDPDERSGSVRQEAAATPHAAVNEACRRKRLRLGRLQYVGGNNTILGKKAQAAKKMSSTKVVAPSRQLNPAAMMYLPPLTTSLLASYFENSRLSNRLLASYLQHVPMLQPSSSSSSSSCSRQTRARSGDTVGAISRVGGVRERTTSMRERSVSRLSSGTPSAKRPVLDEADGGEGGGSLVESVRRLRQQLAHVESQLTRSQLAAIPRKLSHMGSVVSYSRDRAKSASTPEHHADNPAAPAPPKGGPKGGHATGDEEAAAEGGEEGEEGEGGAGVVGMPGGIADLPGGIADLPDELARMSRQLEAEAAALSKRASELLSARDERAASTQSGYSSEGGASMKA